MRYFDSSVPIDHFLDRPAPGWDVHEGFCFSTLLGLETRRAFRRLHGEGIVTDRGLTDLFARIADFERTAVRFPIAGSILARAAGPFPAPLKSLDAIHLATAMLLRESRYPDLVFATHDRRLGMAARLVEFEVVGVEF